MFATLLISGVVLSAPAADSGTEARRRAAELIAQLGDPSYRLREKAANELVKLGSAALEPLRKGLTHPDAEVGDRCRKLLPLALDHHLQEQIAIFLGKPDGPIPEDLPGIKRWVKIAGTAKESRQLYALLVREQRRFLIEIEQHPDNGSQRFQNFCLDVYNRTRTKSVEARREAVSYSELVLYLFLGADPEFKKNTGVTIGVSHLHANVFINSTYLATMLSGGSANDATKKLFLSWLEQERNVILIRRGYQLAAAADLKEAAPLAMRVAADKTILPNSRSYALMGAVKLFGPTHLKQLEELMKDDTVVGRTTVVNGQPASAEIRDIALGVALQATGQNPADYGFERLHNNNVAAISYYYYTLTEKQREQAFAKWKEWSEKQKK